MVWKSVATLIKQAAMVTTLRPVQSQVATRIVFECELMVYVYTANYTHCILKDDCRIYRCRHSLRVIAVPVMEICLCAQHRYTGTPVLA